MLSVPIILLILGILAAVFGTMVAGPVGPLVSIALLIAAAVAFVRGRGGARRD